MVCHLNSVKTLPDQMLSYHILHIQSIEDISKTMLLWNGLLVLFILLAGFLWNMARPQLHLLSLTVNKLQCQASYFTLRSQNLQYKTHPEFWPSHRQIFKTSLYYKPHLILENFDGRYWVLIHQICRRAVTWHYLRRYCRSHIISHIFMLINDIISARWAPWHNNSINYQMN